jgi:hypothetical protein
MNADFIPFVILSVLALFSGFLLKGASKSFAVLFSVAGLLPLISVVSNSERWPIPLELELVGFICPLPLLIVGCILVGARGILSGDKAIVFWVSSLFAIGSSAYIALVTLALSSLPT